MVVKRTQRRVQGVPQRTQMTPPEEESAGDGHRGPWGHRGQRGRTRPPGRDGAMEPMGPVGPRGFPGRDGLSTTGGPFTSSGLGIAPVFNANLSTIGMENSLHYLGESLNHVMQFQQNVESEHGRTLKYDCEESAVAGSSFRAISGKYTTEGI